MWSSLLPLLFSAAIAWAGPLHAASSSFPPHGNLPGFSVRLGNDTASVCNSSTPGVSGFLDTHDNERSSSLFFWLFESKNDPSRDPVILWMTGGPGASSTGVGNLMELGPCRIAPEGGYTIENPYGWNTNATVLFVDQPVSVGFSVGSEIPQGLTEASTAMDVFIRQLFIAFPDLADRDFYIAGESYGGSWVPALAASIVDSEFQSRRTESVGPPRLSIQNGRMQAAYRSSMHAPIINLKGIMIGNGLIRTSVQNPGNFEAACSGPDSLLDTEQCLEWAPRAMWCENNLGICETAGWTTDECKYAREYCAEMGNYVTGELHRNPYDWRRSCYDQSLCYDEVDLIQDFLNRTDVKVALGADSDQAYNGVSYEVLETWDKIGDLWKSSDVYVNKLLDEGIRTLIYVGDKDFYCHAAGMRRLVNQGLSWHGHPFFRFRELAPWYHDSKVAGRWKSYQELTYAEIYNSGHLAPYDLPGEVSSLINGWLLGGHPPGQ